jgi:hypothetical protein
MAGLGRSRWWLDGIRQAVEWLSGYSIPSVWYVLKRLNLSYKRGRQYLHSPALDYNTKMAVIAQAYQQALTDPVNCVMLYEDELTYYLLHWLRRGEGEVKMMSERIPGWS